MKLLYTKDIDTLKKNADIWTGLTYLFKTVSLVAFEIGRMRKVEYSFFQKDKQTIESKVKYVKELKILLNFGNCSFL